ncbi:MAG: DNA-3-methyladenine glycosylase family protein [Candidatus Thorarchaeota archaeon]
MKTLTVDRFSLFDTIECGQTFTWTREGDGYVNVDSGQVIYVEQREDILFYETSSHSVDLSKLFRLNDPLDEIQAEITRRGFMQKSIDFAPNLRIISDPLFPCLFSFISSIQKNIPAIHKLMNGVRQKWGPSFEFKGKTYHGFPSLEDLAYASIRDFEELNAGYRSKFFVRTIEAMSRGDVTEEQLKTMKYPEAHESLKTLHGVGDKVADCVCLFSLGFLEAFPIDVWIEKVIQDHYRIFEKKGKSYQKKSEAARLYFGQYAGYAQEYLYYFSRNKGVKPES